MFRAAIWAVLAVALSSSVATAQTLAPEAETLLSLNATLAHQENYLALWISYDLSEPETPALENYFAFPLAYDLPAPIETRLDLSPDGIELTRRLKKAYFSATTAWSALDRTRQIELSLYASQGALQVLDLVTTSKALGAGHREANPLFKSGNLSAMAVVKAGTVALQFFAVERLRKTRPKTARWLIIGTNALMSIVVLNNAVVLMN